MQYSVYQIVIPRTVVDLLNKVGWGGLEDYAELEPMKIKMDLDFDGSESWKPEYFAHYKLVATVEAESLEDVFRLTNLWDEAAMNGSVEVLTKMRSASVGDLICCAGEFFMVEGFGFAKVEIR